jgi:hypothetical protein
LRGGVALRAGTQAEAPASDERHRLDEPRDGGGSGAARGCMTRHSRRSRRSVSRGAPYRCLTRITSAISSRLSCHAPLVQAVSAALSLPARSKSPDHDRRFGYRLPRWPWATHEAEPRRSVEGVKRWEPCTNEASPAS